MSDYISRKAAIKSLGEEPEVWSGNDEYAQGLNNQWHYDINALKGLPSAQPYTDEEMQKIQELEQAEIQKAFQLGREDALSEIIRCKDCKHFEYDHPYIIQGIPVLGHEVCNAWGDGCKTDENGYCFMAERRTDEQIH